MRVQKRKAIALRRRSHARRASISLLVTGLISVGCATPAEKVSPTIETSQAEAPLRWVSKMPFFGNAKNEPSDPASPPSMVPSQPQFRLAANRTQTAAEDLSLGDDTLALDQEEIESLPGMAKAEPMALATGVEVTNVAAARPAASAVGSHNQSPVLSQNVPPIGERVGADIATPIADPPVVGSDSSSVVKEPQVIDLSSSLGMAGGNAWTIQIARQRTVEAHADLKTAQALWLPSLQLGIGWNNHGGRIQATDGQVIEAARSSLFVGGGATLGSAPVAGGSGGPLRLSADLAIADAYFGQKIASRTIAARRHGVSVAQNQPYSTPDSPILTCLKRPRCRPMLKPQSAQRASSFNSLKHSKKPARALRPTWIGRRPNRRDCNSKFKTLIDACEQVRPRWRDDCDLMFGHLWFPPTRR